MHTGWDDNIPKILVMSFCQVIWLENQFSVQQHGVYSANLTALLM